MPTKPKKVKLTLTAEWVKMPEGKEYKLSVVGRLLTEIVKSDTWECYVVGGNYKTGFTNLKAAQVWCEQTLKEME